MRVRRTTSSSLRTAALGVIAAVTVALGIVAVPVAASAVAPIVIDDFNGTVTGTRSVSSTSPSGYGFTESGGVGIVQTYSPNGGSVTGTTLQYSFGSPLDLTSNGNNTEFMIGIESVTRTGSAPVWENAVSAAISVTDTNGTTGVYNTGYQAVTDFNQIMNFTCDGGLSACFTPSPNFHSVASLKVSFYSPRNLSPDVTTIRLTEIRTTPTGGAQPSAPSVTIAPSGASTANPVWIEGSGQLTWDVAITSDGQPATLVTAPTAAGFQAITTGSASLGQGTLTSLGNGSYRYSAQASGAGTVELRAPAGIVTDTWAQSSTAGASTPITVAQGTTPTISPITGSGVVGVALNQQLIASGTPAPTFSIVSGSLPAGVTLNSTTGAITGTPTAAGNTTATVRAQNAIGSRTATVALNIAALAFTSPAETVFEVNQPADFTATWIGPDDTPVTLTGQLPSGVTTTAGNNTLHFGGTPQQFGRFTPTLTLPGGVSQTLTIDVNAAPSISSPSGSTVDGVVGAAVSAQFQSLGWPLPTIEVVGTLPPGLSATPNGTELTVSGTPTTVGTFSFDVRATNAAGSFTFPVTSTINQAAGLGLLPGNTNAPVGVDTVIPISVVGTPAPTVTAVVLQGSQPLPGWIVLEHTDDGWQLVATPDAPTTPVTVLVEVANSYGTQSRSTVITPFVGPSISGPTEITSLVDTAIAPVTLTVGGDPLPQPNTDVTVTGDLHGLQVTQESGKVIFSGTPDATGTSTIEVTATRLGVTATHEVVLTITQAPTIDAGDDMWVSVGDAINRKIELGGYPHPTVAAADLPEGLSIVIDQDGTWLRGTVTESGEHLIILSAVNGTTTTLEWLRMTVNQPARITSDAIVSVPVGEDFTFTVTSTGYPVPSLITSTLPVGVSFVDNGDGTGTLSGRPAVPGTSFIVINAMNLYPDVQLMQFTAIQKPVIAAEDSYDFPVHEPVDIAIDVTGFPTPAASVTGLPDGLVADGTPTGIRIHGTPTQVGLFTPSVIAVNSAGASLAKPNMTVGSVPVATVPVDPRYRVDEPLTAFIAVSGFPAPTITTTALPVGLSLTRIDDNLWKISGTPTEVGTTDVFVRAENGFDPVWETPITLVIDSVPQFTSPDNATFAIAESGTFAITTTGYPNATLTATALPDGLSFTANADGTATLAGTPTQSGEFSVTLTAENGTEDVTQELTITVTEPAAITGPADARFRAGVESDVIITATGFPTPELSATGVPDGLVFTDNHDGTATLSGTPATGGLSDLVVTATNVRGSVDRTIPVTITELPQITSADSATVGVDFRQAITVSGYPVPTVTAENLPAGVTLVNDADGVALVGAGADLGVHEITLHADAEIDGTDARATQPFTLMVEAGPRITSGSALDTHVGDAITFPVTVTGFPVPTLSVADLPDGVTFVDNGDGTGLLSGATSDGGQFTISVMAENARGTDLGEVVVTSTEDPTITSADSAVVGSEFVLPVTTDGFPAPEVSAVDLPTGVQLTEVDGSLALVGTDVRGGSYTFTLRATNAVGSVDQTFTLTVEEAPAFTSADTLTAQIGDEVQFTVTTTGFPAASIVDAGLPAGLTLTDNQDGTATITGIPTESGASTVMLTAANSIDSVLQLLRITVTAPTVFTSPAAADFREGDAGSFTVRTDGFPVASLTVDGAIPDGLSFVDAGDGSATISGTPTTPGTYSVTITATPGAVPTAGVLRSLIAAITARAEAADAAVAQTLVITIAKRVVEPTPTPTSSGTPTPTPTDPGTPTPTPTAPETPTPTPTDPGTPTPTPTAPGTPTPTPTDPGTPTPTPTDPTPSSTGTASPAPTHSIPAVPASPSATHLPATGMDVSGAPVAIALLLAGLGLFALARRRTHRSE
ncbi:beta strand repeat-containing protein [Microbacterium gorillae]|uniref:beta strand repeat-containing protein n=1 Tax=Microbacterium gorillae TaxID=1231063 RepID=UPI003D959E1C